MPISLLIVSNGPGELASWVKPVVRAWRRRHPDQAVGVALVWCPYASGEEARAVGRWPEPPLVARPGQTARWLATARPPAGFTPADRGVVLHLGGDQLWAVALGARLGWPVAVYTETTGRWTSRVAGFLCADEAVARRVRAAGAAPDAVTLIGNLMVDAVTAAGPRRELEATVGLLPGSKPFKVQWVTPLFLRVADLIRQRRPDTRFLLPLAPTVPLSDLVAAAADAKRAGVTGGVTAQLVEHAGEPALRTEAGTLVRVEATADPRFACRDLTVALTLPGTNTAELAVLGVPMVVALPLHRPEVIPVDGLLGRVGDTPLLGAWLKRRMAAELLRHRPLMALPNQRLGRAATPELMGAFPPEELADLVLEVLTDPGRRQAITRDLKGAMGDAGAATRLVEALGTLPG
ncbi:MAG: hypothetical protein VKS61_07805 [Candidatus Sericytochromatia bacterium]|nr:hypothetical protein [Candidatus Sericytochromatia bacterium]